MRACGKYAASRFHICPPAAPSPCSIHILRVAPNQKFKAMLHGVPLLLAARTEPYVFNDPTFRPAEATVMASFANVTDKYICHQVLHEIRLDQGEVALAWLDNKCVRTLAAPPTPPLAPPALPPPCHPFFHPPTPTNTGPHIQAFLRCKLLRLRLCAARCVVGRWFSARRRCLAVMTPLASTRLTSSRLMMTTGGFGAP